MGVKAEGVFTLMDGSERERKRGMEEGTATVEAKKLWALGGGGRAATASGRRLQQLREV